MTTEYLTIVLKGSVENSRRIGHGLVRAYDVGGRRTLLAADRGFTKLLTNPTVALSDPIRARVRAAGKQVAELVNGGVKFSSAAAVKAIDRVCDGSEALLGNFHERASRIDNVYAARAVDWLVDAGLPAAELGRELTAQLAVTAAKLAVPAAGRKARAAGPRRRKAHAKRARH
jgi:hypothetical protein